MLQILNIFGFNQHLKPDQFYSYLQFFLLLWSTFHTLKSNSELTNCLLLYKVHLLLSSRCSDVKIELVNYALK